MEIALLILFTAMALAVAAKVGVLLQSAVWNWRNGESVVEHLLVASPPTTPGDFSFRAAGEAVVLHGGDRGPIGIYPHAFWVVAIKPFSRPSLLSRGRACLRFALSLWVLFPAASILLVLGSSVYTGSVHTWIGYGCSLLLITMSLASATCTGVGAITNGPFSWIFLGLPAKYRTPAGHVLGNVSAFAASVFFFGRPLPPR